MKLVDRYGKINSWVTKVQNNFKTYKPSLEATEYLQMTVSRT